MALIKIGARMIKKITAIWVLTSNACVPGQKLLEKFDNSILFFPENKKHEIELKIWKNNNRTIAFDNFSEILKDNFHQFQKHVFIMATGIVVRMIAALIKDKTTDPAVVVLDEDANHVISLLSGHLGGANQLTHEISNILYAKPVITTASDLKKIIAFDSMAYKINARVENKENIKLTSSVLLQGGKIAFIGPVEIYNMFYKNSSNIIFYSKIDYNELNDFNAVCVVSEKEFDIPDNIKRKTLFIRPEILYVGIGLNRNTKQEEIEDSLEKVLKKFNLSRLSIKGFASIEEKSDEPGLLSFVNSLKLPIQYVSKNDINNTKSPDFSPTSEYAMKHMGVFGVAEPASFIAAGKNAELIVKKQKIGNVTVAISRSNNYINNKSKGKLFLVGIGPGSIDHMTINAHKIIEISDVIAGYHKYLDLIKPLISEKKIISSPMTKETERAYSAIKAAQEGQIVSFICSGDTGIYGMAGLVLEILKKENINIDFEISPGITASTSAASLVGAPLMNDYITLSLSDLLTPTEKILKRISTAASSDMVTVIYNPRSKKRFKLIEQLQKDFLKNHDPLTPVAIITHALRTGQVIKLTTLSEFLNHNINMNSVVIIGNSDTIFFKNTIFTKRGYDQKRLK